MQYINDLRLSTEVEEVHPLWGKPYVKGTIKAFFVPSVHFGREIVELIQRMDVEYENVTIDRITSLNIWGFGDITNQRGGIGDYGNLFDNLEAAMTSEEEFDVIVLPPVAGWGLFTEKTRKAILRRVEQGAGLVLVQPFIGDEFDNIEEFEKLSPLKPLFKTGIVDTEERWSVLDYLVKEKWLPQNHYVTSGVPFELFPYDEMGFFPYEANGEVIIKTESGKPVAAVKEFGKGRIIAFAYYARDILPQHSDYLGWDNCDEALLSQWHGAMHSLPFNYLEYFYSLINRSIIWASGKEPECRIDEIKVVNDAIYPLLSLKQNVNIDFLYRITNLYDETIIEADSRIDHIDIPTQLKNGGNYRADIFARVDEKISDWSTVLLHYALKSTIKSININKSVFKPGETLEAKVNVDGTVGNLELQVVDDFNNILYKNFYDIKNEMEKGFGFEYKIEPQKSVHVSVVALLRVDGLLIQKEMSANIVVSRKDRRIRDFEVILAPQNRGQGDLLPLQNKLLRKMGVTGMLTGQNIISPLIETKGLGIYFYHSGPYVERKKNYLKTKDKSFLQSINCINDPAILESNYNVTDKVLAHSLKYTPVSYAVLGEGSITCYTDELDLCFCTNCMKEMRNWLKNEYSGLEKLNIEWGTCFSEWDAVEPYTYFEAKKTGQFASWGDHRRFMTESYLGMLEKIKNHIRATDPEGTIRMGGTQIPTPYTGSDFYLLHQHIGHCEAYSGGNQYEYHRSFAKPDTTIGGWFGYGVKGLTVQNNLWYALAHGLSVISIWWEYYCLNFDFTYSKSARDIGEVVKEIKREGIGMLYTRILKRNNLGIAIHFSMPSVYGAYMMSDNKRFDNIKTGWINILEDIGYQYDFIATQQIEMGELFRGEYKVLILPYSIALSSKEVAEIKKFVNNGGIVVGDIQTGLMDVHCKLYEKGSLDEVFGIERVFTFAKDFYICDTLVHNKDFNYFECDLTRKEGFQMIEGGTWATTGKAAFVNMFIDKVSAVVVNEYGKGKGVYLNLSLDAYAECESQDIARTQIRDIIRKILSLSDVRKPVTLSKKDGSEIEERFETVYYNEGKAEYLVIIKDLGGELKVNYDGLIIEGRDDVETIKEDISLTLKDKVHVYDVREKKYLGFTDVVDLEINDGEAKLVSLLPDKMENIYADMPDKIERGQTFSIKIKLCRSNPDWTYKSVVSINFYNPQGEYNSFNSENIAIEESNIERAYKVPFNEKPGEWTITVKDAATGVTAEKKITVF